MKSVSQNIWRDQEKRRETHATGTGLDIFTVNLFPAFLRSHHNWSISSTCGIRGFDNLNHRTQAAQLVRGPSRDKMSRTERTNQSRFSYWATLLRRHLRIQELITTRESSWSPYISWLSVVQKSRAPRKLLTVGLSSWSIKVKNTSSQKTAL